MRFNIKDSIVFAVGFFALFVSCIWMPIFILNVSKEFLDINLSIGFVILVVLFILGGIKHKKYEFELVSVVIITSYLILSVVFIVNSYPSLFYIESHFFFSLTSLVFVIRFSYLFSKRKEIYRYYIKRKLVDINDPRLIHSSIGIPREKKTNIKKLYRLLNNLVEGRMPMFIGIGVALGGSMGKSLQLVSILFSVIWLLLVLSFAYSLANVVFAFVFKKEIGSYKKLVRPEN